MSSQPRQHPRYALEATVKLTTPTRESTGRTANLSRGGLCAMMAEPYPVGERVDIDVALVFDNDSLSEPLSLKGRVVWCTKVEPSFQVGLAFTGLTPETVKYLDVFLKFLDGSA